MIRERRYTGDSRARSLYGLWILILSKMGQEKAMATHERSDIAVFVFKMITQITV